MEQCGVPHKETPRVFKGVYWGNIIVMGLFLLVGVRASMEDLPVTDEGLLTFLFGFVVFAIAYAAQGTIFVFIFLLLNIWGAIRYKQNKVRYLIIAVLTILWIGLSAFLIWSMIPSPQN